MVEHLPKLRGLGATSDSGPPLILQCTDHDFIGTMMEKLRSSDAFSSVSKLQAVELDKNNTLRLYQPVHRTFHVVLVDAHCSKASQPPIESRRIDSAGLVIRRVARRRAPDAIASNPFPQGWLSVGRSLRGWVKLEDPDLDPDPCRRRHPTGGHPTIAARAMQQARAADGAEQVTPLFVAPPDVCEAAGRTILFGVIQTASAEMSESPAPPISPDDYDQPGADPDSSLRHVVPRFVRKVDMPIEFRDLAGRVFSGASAAAFAFIDETTNGKIALQTDSDKNLLTEFLNFVRFFTISLDAFGDSPNAVVMRELLSEIRFPDVRGNVNKETWRRADEILAQASKALVAPDAENPGKFTMPSAWPSVPKELSERIYKQIKINLAANLSAIQPGIPRYDDPTARYRLRAFMRVKRNDGCPPTLCWTEPSEQFSIVPWFENGVVAPIQIRLPNITSESVKSLKPNVAFMIPKRLFNFLNSIDPKGIIEGKSIGEGSNFGLDWICSFNVSIVFTLAFIVMFIFLFLLNIVFWWAAYIKICFPVPSFSKREES